VTRLSALHNSQWAIKITEHIASHGAPIRMRSLVTHILSHLQMRSNLKVQYR